MKCKYAVKDIGDKYLCSKNNDPDDMGDCIYRKGVIKKEASFHCSEGKKIITSVKICD